MKSSNEHHTGTPDTSIATTCPSRDWALKPSYPCRRNQLAAFWSPKAERLGSLGLRLEAVGLVGQRGAGGTWQPVKTNESPVVSSGELPIVPAARLLEAGEQWEMGRRLLEWATAVRRPRR